MKQFIFNLIYQHKSSFLFITLITSVFGTLLTFIGLQIKQEEPQWTYVTTIALLMIFLLRWVLQVFREIFTHKITTQSKVELYKKLNFSLTDLKHKYDDATLIQKISSDYKIFIETTWSSCIEFFSQIIIFFISLYFLISKSIDHVYYIFLFGLLVLGFSLLIKNSLKKLIFKTRILESDLFQSEKNYIEGFHYLLTSQRLDFQNKKISDILKGWTKNENKISILNSFSSNIAWGVKYLFIVVLLTPLAQKNHLTPESLYWLYLLLGSFSQLSWSVYSLGALQSYWQRSKDLLYAKPKSDSRCFDKNLQFRAKNLTLSYSPLQFNKDLGPIDFHWQHGEKILITGPSGVGKSTLLKSLVHLHTNYSGSLIGPCEKTFCIEYINQDPFFFEGRSLSENLNLKKMKNIHKFHISALQLDDFIDTLPRGLETLIGQEGLLPSKGQKTRLAIFRAIINNPDVLIIDEPTSGLDWDLARSLLQHLFHVFEDKILILCDHNKNIVTQFHFHHCLDLKAIKTISTPTLAKEK